MYRESRDNERVQRKQAVAVWPYFEADPTLLEQPVQATLFDASKDGLCFEAEIELAKDRRVSVRMEVESVNTIGSNKTEFITDAIVRWTKPLGNNRFRTGVEFDALPKVQREKWTTFMGKWRTRLF